MPEPEPDPLDVFESADSRAVKLSADGTSDSKELRLIVRGTEDDAVALAAIIDHIAPGLLVDSRPLVADAITLEWIAPETWGAKVDYASIPFSAGSNRPKAVGESTFSFDGSGGETLLTQAIAQTRFGASAPEYGNAINVDENGVQGVNIVVPACTFTIKQKFVGTTITLAWLRDIIAATGTVNSDTFLGFTAGEVLFLGPAGSQPIHYTQGENPAPGPVDVEFRFSASPNLTGLTIGGITSIAKPGQDYLWVKYRPKKEGAAIIQDPIGVYVAQTYRRTAFSGLGIVDPTTNFPVWA